MAWVEPERIDRCTGFDQLCWRLLIWGVGLSTPLLAALKPRSFQAGEIDFLEASLGAGKAATQGLYLFFIALCCVVAVRRLCREDRVPLPGAVRKLWLVNLLLAAMPALSSVVSGNRPPLGLLGTFAFYSAAALAPLPSLRWVIRELRVMLLALFVYGSLAAALLVPQWAWNLNYAAESSMALFGIRLFGTCNHANALAPLAIFGWMLGRFPGGRLAGERWHAAAALSVLLLSQSKTNWGIALLLAGVYAAGRVKLWGRFRRSLTYGAALLFGSALLVYLVQFSAVPQVVRELSRDPQVFTLTGRLPLWIVAVEMWLKNPWLGQGMEGWSSEALLELVTLLGWVAPNAHNQVLQILSQAGLAGLLVLLLWALSCLAILRGTPAELRRPLWWLTAFFLLPGFTEVVLQFSVGPGTTVLTWVYFALILVLGKTYLVAPAPQNAVARTAPDPTDTHG